MPPASAAREGTLLLGVTVQELEGLAPGAGHRETGDGRGLASQGLSSVLDLDSQAEERTSGIQPRDESSDPEDGRCQPALGRTPHPRRAAEVEYAPLRTNSHHERNHQGLGNRLIIEERSGTANGPIQIRQRLGGMLNYYYRQAA